MIFVIIAMTSKKARTKHPSSSGDMGNPNPDESFFIIVSKNMKIIILEKNPECDNSHFGLNICFCCYKWHNGTER